MDRIKDQIITIKDRNKKVLHSYTLKPHEVAEHGVKLALEDAAAKKMSLPGAVLAGFKIENAVLTGLDLQGADLKGIQFKNCNLDGVNLFRADLQHSQIINTSMKQAQACEADFQHSVILRSNLSKSNIIHSSFSSAIIHRSNLDHLNAEIGSNLFEGAFMIGCSIQHSHFNSLLLMSSTLIDCNLAGSSLGHSQLSGTCFNRCDLQDLHFNASRGKDTQFINSPISGAHLDTSTLLKPVINHQVVEGGIHLLELLSGAYSPERQSPKNTGADQVALMLAAIKARDNAAIISLKIKHDAIREPFQMHGQNLSHLNLNGLDLSHMDFSGSLFTQSSMNNTNLSHSILSGAIIGAGIDQKVDAVGVQLIQAELKTSYLSGIDLSAAKASDCNLSFSKLHRVQAIDADLQRALLQRVFIGNRSEVDGADLSGAEIMHTRMLNTTAAKANFSGADIAALDVLYSDVSGANFVDAQIQGFHLGHSDASHAVFKGVPLVGLRALHSDLSGADFSGGLLSHLSAKHSDLAGSNLTGSIIKSGVFDDIDWKKSELDKSCFIDTVIKNSNLNTAKNIPESALVSAGMQPEAEHKPLSREESVRHLNELRSRIIAKNSSFDLG